jgi:hypothetical protein
VARVPYLPYSNVDSDVGYHDTEDTQKDGAILR